MVKYTKHVVLHFDIIVEAENEEKAQKIYETITLANPEYVAEGSEIISEETEWKVLE